MNRTVVVSLVAVPAMPLVKTVHDQSESWNAVHHRAGTKAV